MKPTRLDQLNAADLPVLLGRYELQHIQGEGGMARVFRAELMGPAGFRKTVALKVLKAKPSDDFKGHAVEQLKHEARLGGRLKHQNIVDVYDLGEIEGQVFIAMEFVDGMTLRGLRKARGRLPPAIIMQIAVGITSGLIKAHSLVNEGRPTGSVHCDIKPSNILISWDGDVKLADFGIATLQNRAIVERGGRHFVCGTPLYMSPEQLVGDVLDGRSDLFSWAIVIAWMALGEHPFGGRSTGQRLLDFDEQKGSMLTSSAQRDIDRVLPGLGLILHRCLSIEPDQRPENALELYQSLVVLQDHIGQRPTLLNWLNHRDPADQKDGESRSDETRGLDAPKFGDRRTSVRSNIGPQGHFFVGRSDESEQLAKLVSDGARLLTIKGPGGAGKTRLSRHFARSVLRDFLGGVWFADLTEARSFMGTIQVVAHTLDVALTGDDEAQMMQQLGRAIASRGPLMLVLDNCEQVIDYIASMVSRWLELAPEIVIITTSRESLSILGERVFELGPLLLADGVELFRLRARDAGSLWARDEDQLAIIEQIVQALDGLPLAIELAAARARLMSPHQILDRLQERFLLLRQHSRGQSSRQATLRSLIDWSWDLLKPWERSALAQLSVFRDGFFMDAAEAVLDLSNYPNAPWSIDVVGSLLDKSLLHSKASLDQPRFDMFVSIHEYAKEKLAEVDGGGLERGARERHAAHYAVLGLQDSQSAGSQETIRNRLSILHREFENLLAGIEYGSNDSAPLCCLAAIRVLGMTGPITAAIDMADRVLDLPDLPPRLRMLIEIQQSKCLRISGRTHEARLRVRDAGLQTSTRTAHLLAEPFGAPDLELQGQPTNQEGSRLGSKQVRDLALIEAERLIEKGRIERVQNNYGEAFRCFRNALDIFHRYERREREGMATGELGILYRDMGQYEQAIQFHTKAIDMAREVGNKNNLNRHQGNLAQIYRAQGHYERAIKYLSEAIDVAQEIGDKRSESAHLGSLGNVCQDQGQNEQSTEWLTKGLAIVREVGDRRNEGIQLGCLGEALLSLGLQEEAEVTFREAISICDEALPFAAGVYRGTLALSLAQQDKHEEAHALLEVGEVLTKGRRQEHAKFLIKKAQTQHLGGDSDGAQVTLMKAQGISTKLNVYDQSQVAPDIMALKRMLFSDAPEGTEDKRSRDLMEAQRLMELGNIEREHSESVAALRAYQDAQELFQEHGDRIGEGLAWGNMAIVHQEQGEYERAVTLLKEALQIARETNDSLGISVHLGNLGIAYQNMGQYEPAIAAYTQALEIYNDIGNKRHRGNIIGNLGILYAEQGDYARAIPILEEALDISREVEEKRFQGVHLANLGLVYQNLNQTQRAHDYFTQALGIALEIGSKLHEGIYLGNLGDTLYKLGRLDEAEAHYRKAISISDQTFPIAAGAFRGALAHLLAQQDKLDETLALLEKGESQVKSHDVEYVKFLSMKGQVRHCAGDVQGAKASLEEARKIVTRLDVHKDSEARKGIRELEAVLFGDSPGEAVLDPDHGTAIIEAQRMSRPLGRAEADADTVAVGVAPAVGSSSTESEDADTLLIPR